jgi:uncharacterized protein
MTWPARILTPLTVLTIAAEVVLCEGALHIPPSMRPKPQDALATSVAASTDADWREVHLRASDGAVLNAWLFTPREPNGDAVILLHGVADTRQGMLGHARLLLRHHYSVLTPDCRGHGTSGGSVTTYGVKESADVVAWANWLEATIRPHRLYGLGESLGASILLQTIPREPRLRAVVAECPFSTFRDVAYDRLAGKLGLWRGVVRIALSPTVEAAFLYARAKYGVDLGTASPVAAVRTSHTPILLIHGEADENIPIAHSRRLRDANPALVTLWQVPGAGHTAALPAQPEEYERRVVEWFSH